MANFCRFCGSALEEGQVCACQANQAAPQAAPVATAAPAAAPKANFLLDALKAYLKAPKAAAAAVAEDKQGLTIAGIFAGVNFLAIFLALWRFVGAWIVKNASLSDVDVDELIEKAELEFPIFPMLLAGLGIAVIAIAVAALAVFVVGKLNKQEVDLKKQMVIAAVHSLLPTAVLVVGILLSFLAWWFLAVALGICLVLWVINVMGELPAGENQITASAVVAVVLVLAVVLGGVLANWSIGETSRGGDTINEGIEDAREAAEDGDYPYSNKTPIHTLLDTLIYIEN